MNLGDPWGLNENRLHEELDQKPFHPLNGQEPEEFLHGSLPNSLPMDTGEKPIKAGAPSILRDPMVFMRKRSLDFNVIYSKSKKS